MFGRSAGSRSDMVVRIREHHRVAGWWWGIQEIGIIMEKRDRNNVSEMDPE